MHERQMCLYSKQERGETAECCRAMPRDHQRLPGGLQRSLGDVKTQTEVGGGSGGGGLASMRAQEYMFMQLSVNTPVRSRTQTLAANHPPFSSLCETAAAEQRIRHLSTPAVICESIK